MKAAVATDVTVDLEGLDCTLCLDPLQPPVFQCAAGHAICSTCYEKLLENDYCQLCSINTTYNRCFAVERILQSVKIPCSNAGYGCVAKMTYNEIGRHEMNCLKAVCDFSGSNTMQSMPLYHGLPTDYYTLVIPKFSPSASMNISINYGERKIDNRDNKKSSTCDTKSSTGSVVKMGPCGGGDGNAWKMDMQGVNRIVKVIADPDALDCPRCLRPLAPRVYQCAAGHVLCSSCHKCTGGNILCQEKTCPKTAGSGSIAGRICVKMGPCGGGGGEAWEMDMSGVKRIVKLVLWHDIMVDAMMVLYEHDDGLALNKPWGVSCGRQVLRDLSRAERVPHHGEGAYRRLQGRVPAEIPHLGQRPAHIWAVWDGGRYAL